MRSSSNSHPLQLPEDALDRLLKRHGVTGQGRELVRRVRSSEPFRSVRPGPGHVTGAYPSRKMGRTLSYESLLELSCIMEFELLEGNAYELFDQPCKLVVRAPDKRGRQCPRPTLPDFLLIAEDFLGFVECKTEERLIELAREDPGRWSRDSSGTWRSLPAERAARRYGLGYRVRSSSSFRRTLLDNLAFLQDYLLPGRPSVDEAAARRVRDLVAAHVGLSLEQLLLHTKDRETVYRMIAIGDLHVDLARHLLSHPHLSMVFVDAQTARVREAALVREIGAPETAGSLSDCAVRILQRASESDREEALQRFKTIRGVLDGSVRLGALKSVPRRTAQKWIAAWRAAERDCGCGYLGLYPLTRKRGNRRPRLEPEPSLPTSLRHRLPLE